MEIDYERLDFAGTLGKLAELTGRELLLELRVGSLDGPFRLAARGVLTGHPDRQADLSSRRSPGDDVEAFQLDSGAFFTVKEADFSHSSWHAGGLEGQASVQPRLNVVFADSVLHVAVLGVASPDV